MGRTPFTDKVDLTDGAHPGFYGPVNLFLMGNIAFRIYKGLNTLGEGRNSISKNKPPTLKPEFEPAQLMCLGPPFFPTS